MEVVSLTFATKNRSAIEMHLGAASKRFHNSFSTRRLTAHSSRDGYARKFNMEPELFSHTGKSKGAVTEVLSERKHVSSVQKSSTVPVITIKIWAKVAVLHQST